MKHAILIIGIAAATFSIRAQNTKERDVPIAVHAKFAFMYPTIDSKIVKWEKENGLYEANYEEGSIETSLLFDSTGNFVQRELEIQVTSLPKGVRTYVSKNLAGKKIDEAARITDANDVVTYEAEVGGIDYIFDLNGNFLKKEIEENKMEDEDK